MIICKKLCLLLAMCLLLTGGAFNVSAVDSYSWYCKRINGNVQPPLPEEFTFINDYSVIWLNTSRTDAESNKVAYLTFDAGYENGNVAKILDVLKEKNVIGAFFILINLIESNPDLVLRMEQEGHLVCNHTARHKDMTKITDLNSFEKELNLLNDSYKSLTGSEIKKYYRPPEGRFSAENLKFADSLDYKTVFWSFAYPDWDNSHQMSAEKATKIILENLHNGEVMLLHPTSATNAEILGDVIRTLKADGYRFGTLDELTGEAE